MTTNTMPHRYLAEFIGTFGIVFAPVALSGTGHFEGSDAGLMAASWVSGLAVLAMIYALGHISAAHFNPAVTLGFAVARRFPWRFVLPYWAAQFAGAVVAAQRERACVCDLFEVSGRRSLRGPSLRRGWPRCCSGRVTAPMSLHLDL